MPDTKLREWARETIAKDLGCNADALPDNSIMVNKTMAAGESIVRRCAEIAGESDDNCAECNGCGHMVGLRILREFGLDEVGK